MKFKLTALLIALLSVLAALPKGARADDYQTLQMAVASSSYFEFFASAALNYLQGGSSVFPTFDPQAARGLPPGNNSGLPPCDRGGYWISIDQTGNYYVCLGEDDYRYCPYGTTAVPFYQDTFYCQLTVPDYYPSRDNLENDSVAVEGIKWFMRSQAHAKRKFEAALAANRISDFASQQALKNEGCAQYTESSFALTGTIFPANLPPVGVIHNTLLNDMLTALNATKAIVCP